MTLNVARALLWSCWGSITFLVADYAAFRAAPGVFRVRWWAAPPVGMFAALVAAMLMRTRT
jgi:hypothetical protein